MQNTYDVAIVGAGIAGLSLACALAQQSSLSIAVLEAKPFNQRWKTDLYHHRVSAISLSSMRIFQQLKIWEKICAERVSPFERIEVYDEHQTAVIHFDSREINESVLGYIIENNLIQEILLQQLQKYPHVQVYAPIQLQTLTINNDAAILQAENNLQIIAQLIVAADGANSWVRNAANIAVTTEDYGHDAIVATVQTAKPHMQTARQIFLPTGPLAFLPLKEANTSSIVWSMSPAAAKQHMTMSDEEFKHALTEVFSSQLGEIKALDQRYSFALKKQRALNYIANRVALISDAAHTMHPLAGQGANLGLLDAASLAEVILDAYQLGRDPFANLVLRRYERWRKAENNVMLHSVDFMKNIFASNNKQAKGMRSISFYLAETQQFLRAFFTRFAVGNRAGLPKLAQQQLT